MPSGLTVPRPVMTTRRGHFLAMLPLDVVDRLADGLDLLGLVVGDGDLELFFQLHDQLDDVERVGADVLDERGLCG